MWQRFSNHARIAVFAGMEEARARGADYLAPTHLFLGLLQQTSSTAYATLEALGFQVSDLKAGAEGTLEFLLPRLGNDIVMDRNAKRVIDLAYDEARFLGDTSINTEHLLLGLIRLDTGFPYRALASRGIDLERARAEVVAQQKQRPSAERDGFPSKSVPSTHSSIWHRFSREALDAIQSACEEAKRVGESYVSTEHLLLGLIAHSESTASRSLIASRSVLDRLREELVRKIPVREPIETDALTLTPRSKRAIDHAFAESRTLGDDYIGSEHLLLGLLAEGDGLAARTLAKLDLRLETLRGTVAERQEFVGQREARVDELPIEFLKTLFALSPPAQPPAPKPPGTGLWHRFNTDARKVVFLAQEEAQRTGENYVVSEHLLCGILQMPQSPAVRALDCLGVEIEQVRSELEKHLTDRPEKRVHTLGLTPRAKRVLDLANEESLLAKSDYIGPEHLLLGLVREEDNGAALVLTSFGVTLENLRVEVARMRRLSEED